MKNTLAYFVAMTVTKVRVENLTEAVGSVKNACFVKKKKNLYKNKLIFLMKLGNKTVQGFLSNPVRPLLAKNQLILTS